MSASKIHKVNQIKTPVLKVYKEIVKEERVIYLIRADKAVLYKARKKKSRIIYIGTTKRGELRIGESAIDKAIKAFERKKGDPPTPKELEVFVWYTTGLQKKKMWEIFEAAALLAFSQRYGDLPKYNDKYQSKLEEDARLYFNIEGLREKIIALGETSDKPKKKAKKKAKKKTPTA